MHLESNNGNGTLKEISSEILISICVPTYNGLPHLARLIDALRCSTSTHFEIVISDDCSSDGTWQYLTDISQQDPRLKCFRNAANLGMDRNFARSVELASGDYVWLCGQDDLIHPEGIDSVIERITEIPQLDFIYLNHIKVKEHAQVTADSASFLPSHHYGHGLDAFLTAHDHQLPTFLPEYIIRRTLWNQSNAAQYFGTNYCQVGVFLDSAKAMHWCHLAGCYVEGLTPVEGWQKNKLAYSKIIFGFFIMLSRALKSNPWIGRKFVYAQYRSHSIHLLYALLLTRGYALEKQIPTFSELRDTLLQYPRMARVAGVTLVTPRFICRLLLVCSSIKRKLKL
jgi:glycosyltransferase involved in cell wall biosynthesis